MTNPWRFAAGYFDSSTGLYKFGTRYYNPGFGRWSQQDPVRGQLKDPTSLNRYLYAGDDPVNLVDPSGLGGITITGKCLGAIALVFIGSIGGFWILGQVLIAANALLAGLGPVGVILAIIIDVVIAAAIVLGLEFAYNTVIAPACGWPQIPYLFQSITINF